MKVQVRPVISCAEMEGAECTWTEVTWKAPCYPQSEGNRKRLER